MALSPKAEAYFNGLSLRVAYGLGHVRRILLLAEIHGQGPVATALEEASELGAYGSDYLNNILEHRRALEPLLGHLHLTRGAEHLDVHVPPSDCSHFTCQQNPDPSL